MNPLPKPAIPLEIDEGLNWPETVPILEAQHIFKDNYDHPTDKNCHCLTGHARYWFDSPYVRCQVFQALRGRIAVLGRRLSTPIPGFNDSSPPELCARIWNAAMADLGYTEGNPEA